MNDLVERWNHAKGAMPSEQFVYIKELRDAGDALVARLDDMDDALRLCVTMLETVNDNLVRVMEQNWNARLKALTHARAVLGDGSIDAGGK